MKLRKIISVILATVLLISALTSCAKTPEDVVNKAEKALTKKPYIIEVDVDYHSTNDTVGGVFEQLERLDTAIYFKNGNIRAMTDLTIDDGDAENRFYSEYTLIDGTVYLNMIYSSGDVRRDIKNKAPISAEQTDSLLDDLTLVGDISLSAFSDVEMTKRDGEYVIVCGGVSDEKRIELEQMLISQLESAVDSAKVNKVKMTLEIEDGRYDTATFECEYDIVLKGKTYVVGMTAELDFDYGEHFDIEAPRDAVEYNTVDIETIL